VKIGGKKWKLNKRTLIIAGAVVIGALWLGAFRLREFCGQYSHGRSEAQRGLWITWR